MTGRSEHLAAPRERGISYTDLPLGNRMQTSLILGDLAIAIVKWLRGQLLCRGAACAEHMAPETPSEPCGAC